jgi:hypothetical protein
MRISTLVLSLAVIAPNLGAVANEFSACRELEGWPDAELEAFLASAEVVEVEDVGEGITEPKRVTLRSGDRTCRAIFKDIDEETNDVALTNRFELGFSDKWMYEVAAYRLDRLLDIGLVPVTVQREIGDATGSLQLWIEDATTLERAAAGGEAIGDEARLLERLMSMYVLDQLIANIDRNFGNVLVRPDRDELFLIDHSRSFRTSSKITSPPAPAATPVTPEVATAMQRLDQAHIDDALGELLSKRQRRAILKRRDRLADLLEDLELLPAG